MHILFVSATRIGEAVLSTGLLSYLVERYPDVLALGVALGEALVMSTTRAVAAMQA